MAEIRVSPEKLTAAAQQIEGLASDYKGQYEQMYRATDEMKVKGFDDKAGEAFINQIAGFKDDLTRMYELMNEYAAFLRQSAAAYTQTQNEAVARAQQLRN